MNGHVYVSVLKPLTLKLDFDITRYPFLRQIVDITMGPWMHTNDTVVIQMENKPDNITVYNEKIWVVKNSQFSISKYSEARPELQVFNSSKYSRLRFQLLLKQNGLLIYLLLMLPTLIVGFLAFSYHWIRLTQWQILLQN